MCFGTLKALIWGETSECCERWAFFWWAAEHRAMKGRGSTALSVQNGPPPSKQLILGPCNVPPVHSVQQQHEGPKFGELLG